MPAIKSIKTRDYERNANFTRIRLTASFHNPLLLDKSAPQARYRPTLSGGHGLGGLSKFGETDGCPCLWAGITALLCLGPTTVQSVAYGYQWEPVGVSVKIPASGIQPLQYGGEVGQLACYQVADAFLVFELALYLEQL